MRRVGHKGCDAIVAGNTLASFDAAREVGVDMIEFDVLRMPGATQMVLAHDGRAAQRPDVPTLEQGLEHLAGAAFDGLELDVDLKLAGYEAEVLAALRHHGLLERSLICSQIWASIVALKQLEPAARVGWSVPHLRRDYTRHPLTAPIAYPALGYYRSRLPTRAAAAIRAGRCEALMAHWRLVTGRLVRAVQDAGGELYVWTVDDAQQIARLEALGVTGVITNDPRLFSVARG